MKYTKLLVFVIALALFIVPFFWLKSGFVDLGGDAGRLYFLAPSSVVQNLYTEQTVAALPVYALIPYVFYLSILQRLFASPTFLISLEHGLQLALSFIAVYLVVKEILIISTGNKNQLYIYWSSIVAGVSYVGFIAKAGWTLSLISQNQVFLNPLIFYLFLRLFLTSRKLYVVGLLILSLAYSENFGFGSVPQIFAFYPMAGIFLLLLFLAIFKKSIPWKILLITLLTFLGLHAFQLVPIVGTVFDSHSNINSTVFASRNEALWYFDQIREQYGKISTNIFQPENWNSGSIFIIFPFLIILAAFIKGKSSLLSTTALFFILSLYLVSANISQFGTELYRKFFEYIPGFIMFRSFYDKWYFVYAFFYSLLLGFSFYFLTNKKKYVIVIFLGTLVCIGIFWRITPFFRGTQFNEYLWQSNNIPASFDLDPDLVPALSYVKNIPNNGNFLTLPLTLPYQQVVMGKTRGAYVGLSMVRFIGGKKDYSGFWLFRPYENEIVTAFENNNVHAALQFFSLLNIKYVFRNTDGRIFDAFPRFPFYKYDMTIDIPVLDSQEGYDKFLADFPMRKIYEKGYFQIYELDQRVVRPTVHIPDVVTASISGVLKGESFRSAYLDDQTCEAKIFGFACDEIESSLPTVTFKRNSSWQYDVSVDIQDRRKPFVLVLSDDYHSSWALSIDNKELLNGIRHVKVNGYANGWIIDPVKSGLSGGTHISLNLGFQRYYVVGRILSEIILFIVFVFFVRYLIRRMYEKK